MPENATERKPHEFEQIQPTKIEITPHSPELIPTSSTRESAASRRKWVLVCIALSVVLVVLVFIFLPQMVVKPNISMDAPIVKSAAVEQVSPWQEAQTARERKEAQDVLAQLLEEQFALEEAQVKLWGQKTFDEAADLAKQGDELYRQQAFAQATDSYTQALAKLTELSVRLPSVTSDHLRQGFDAVKAGNATAAKAAFDIVLQIEPDNSEAFKGLQRVSTLDQVISLAEKAAVEEANTRLDQSQQLLQQALKLDADSERVKSQLGSLKQKILERDFIAAMSKGLSALERSDFNQARSAFQLALKLKPGSQEALSGAQEVTHRIAQNTITSYREQAQKLSEQEQWQAALEKYDAVLKMDASLLFAQKGYKQTSDRARLDQLLQEQIESPARLATEAVYQEANALLKVAATVAQPGPRLQQQILRLQDLMRQAVMPIEVEITSDNQTQVTLLKTGLLGNFLQHRLSLTPGHYILVGKRNGFRDVRREFDVAFNKPPVSVNIQCSEKI